MATEVFTSYGQQCDSNGVPMSGALVYVYDVGTTTLKSVWTDTGLSAAGANPIVCDSSGRHDMRYIATGSYKVVVKTSAEVTVYTRDNIDGRVPVGSGALAIANGGTGATTASAALAALGGSTAAEVADIAADVAELAGTLASSEKTHIATGTTAQRPASPVQGDIRRNTTTSKWEGHDGTDWDNFFIDDDVATQSNMETATSTTTVVTPGRVIYHPGVAKAWVKFSGAAGTIRASSGVSGVVRNSQGNFTITWSTAFSSAHYVVSVCPFIPANSSLRPWGITTQTTTTLEVNFRNNDNSGQGDPDEAYVIAYGDV